MPEYQYIARNLNGLSTQGSIYAEDQDELRRILRKNDLYLTQWDTGKAKREQVFAKAGLFSPKVKIQDMVIAIRQLGTTFRAGLPILEALRIIGSQTNKPALAEAFHDMEASVTEGRSLADGMRKHPKVFNNLVIALVDAGEEAGTLDQTLEVAAMQLDREQELKMKVKAALTYPKIVILACVGTVAVMLTLVVPVFAKIYDSLQAKLPAPTLLLMEVSSLATHFFWLIILFVAAVWYGYVRYKATPGGKRRIDIFSLKIPVVGPILRKVSISRAIQTLAGAMHGGIPILKCLSISANTAGNTVIHDAIIESARNVQEGSSIGKEFEKSGEFPLLVTRMIIAGESTGSVDTMLEEINRFYERDIQYAVDQLTKLIEPVMTIVVGAIVLVILLALYMPIFSIGPTILGNKH